MKIWIFFLFFLSNALCSLEKTDRYVRVNFIGQLGNQMFQAAAAYAVACDYGLDFIIDNAIWGNNSSEMQFNINEIFKRMPIKRPSKGTKNSILEEEFVDFLPPYFSRIKIRGFFENAQYFEKYAEEIKAFYYPPQHKIDYVKQKYQKIFDRPLLVSLHVRTFYRDFQSHNQDYTKHAVSTCYPDIEFYKKAIEYFPKEALFVVTSDYIPWAKQFLKTIDRELIFIEGENHLIDLCIQTQCHHNIFSSSTFGWWGAYLNKNPDKKVITRYWWYPKAHPIKGLLLDDWTIICHEYNPPCPNYSDVV